MHVVVCTVVHHPADARIFYREIQALLDAGHDVTYIAPHAESSHRPDAPHPSAATIKFRYSERVRGTLRTVTIPRAAGRRRLGALRAAKAAMAEQAAGADLLLVHDPELLLVLPPQGQAPAHGLGRARGHGGGPDHQGLAPGLAAPGRRRGSRPAPSAWPSAACT